MKTKMFYRSSWEKKVMEDLDKDMNVKAFYSESLKIRYFRKRGKKTVIRNYIPDFHIVYKNGTEKIVEVKPECYVNEAVNVSKFIAARAYCKQNNMLFEVWTQKEIF